MNKLILIFCMIVVVLGGYFFFVDKELEYFIDGIPFLSKEEPEDFNETVNETIHIPNYTGVVHNSFSNNNIELLLDGTDVVLPDGRKCYFALGNGVAKYKIGQEPQIDIEQVITGTKIKHIVTNSLANIDNPIYYYVCSTSPTDDIEINGSNCDGVGKCSLDEGVDRPNIVNFNDQYDFNYQDLIDTNFTFAEITFQNNELWLGFKGGKLSLGETKVVDPTFSTSSVIGVNLAPINNTVFVIAWCDTTVNDRWFSTYYTNGTLINRTDVDTDAGSCITTADQHVDVSAFNQTSFVMSWTTNTTTTNDTVFGVYDINGNTITAKTVVNSVSDGSTDTSTVSSINETAFVISWIEYGTWDASFEVWSSGGTKIVDETLLDDNAGNSHAIDVAVINETTFVIGWLDDAQNDISFRIYYTNGTAISGTIDVAITSNNAGHGASVSAFNDTAFVIGFFERPTQNAVYEVWSLNGSGAEPQKITNYTIVDAVSANSYSTKVSVINESAFVFSYYDGVTGSIKYGVYTADGTNITNPTNVDDPGISGRAQGTASQHYATGAEICKDNFIFAWDDGGGNATWNSYYPNGDIWNGECSDPPIITPQITNISIRANYTLDLTKYEYDNDSSNFNWSYWINDTTYSLIDVVDNLTNKMNISIVADGNSYINLTLWDESGLSFTQNYINILVDTALPHINFTDPTPANRTNSTANAVFVNVTTNDTNEHSAFIDWNNSLVGWWNFENLPRDFGYVNQSDGFETNVSAGADDGQGITTNGSDFWVTDNGNDFVYHFNAAGANQSDGFFINDDGAGSPRGITTNGSDFWVVDRTDNFVYHFNSAGTNQSDGFETNVSAGADNMWGITTNGSDFWITDTDDNFVYHFNSAGTNQSDGFETRTSAGAGTPRGITTNSSDFWIADVSDDFVYHFNSAGANQSDGFNVGSFGANDFMGLTNNISNNFWLMDTNDAFVYHFKYEMLDIYEGNGTVYDNSSYGNAGKMVDMNNVTVHGKRGQAVLFDGVDDYIDLGQDLSTSSEGTISLWVKPDLDGNQVLVSLKEGTDGQSYFQFRIKSNGKLQILFQPTTPQSLNADGNTVLQVNQWHNVMLRNNGSTISMFVNGEEESLSYAVGDSTVVDWWDDFPASTNWDIGDILFSGARGQFFNGTIDEVMIFNRALTPVEINASYQAGTYRLYNNFTGLSNGVYPYTAYVIDEAGNINVTETRTVNISIPNVAPVLTDIPDNSTLEEIEWSHILDEYVTDDNDADAAIKWIYLNNDTSRITISIDNATNNISVTPLANVTGSVNITLTAEDTTGLLSSNSSFTFNITNTNDPPVVSIGNNNTIAGMVFELNLTAYTTDVDGDTTYFNWSYTFNDTTRVSSIIIDNATGNMSVTTITAQYGFVTISINATDGIAEGSTSSFELELLSPQTKITWEWGNLMEDGLSPDEICFGLKNGGDYCIDNTTSSSTAMDYINIAMTNISEQFDENATFKKDVIIEGTLYGGSPVKIDGINITNNTFFHTEDLNNSLRFSLKNTNSETNASAVISTINDVGGTMSMGIASSNFMLGTNFYRNTTAILSRSRGETIFVNFFNEMFMWLINPQDDNDPNNLVEAMRLDEHGLNVTGNITSDNTFLPQYIFPHINITIPLISPNAWRNITFYQEATDIKSGISHTHDDNTNHTFTINNGGIYSIEYDFDVIDTSASASDIDVAGRVVFINGTEISGSAFETDITKQQIETELAHSFLARISSGDKIVFQFTADDADVSVSTHGTFGEHPDSATIIIEKIANLP